MLKPTKLLFYIIIMLCVLLTLTGNPPELSAQTLPFSSVVMNNTFGQSAQTYLLQGSFPATEIRKKWESGLSITSVAQGNGFWAAIMTTNTGYSAQQYIVDDTFPIQKIEELWDKNFRISAMTYGNNKWTVILSQGTQFAFQAISVTDSFPEEFIKRYDKSRFRIGAMNKGNSKWVVVMNTQTFIITEQFHTVSSEFPLDTISKYYKEPNNEIIIFIYHTIINLTTLRLTRRP